MNVILKTILSVLLVLAFSLTADADYSCSTKDYMVVVENNQLTLVGNLTGQVVYQNGEILVQPEENLSDAGEYKYETSRRLSKVSLSSETVSFRSYQIYDILGSYEYEGETHWDSIGESQHKVTTVTISRVKNNLMIYYNSRSGDAEAGWSKPIAWSNPCVN